MLRGGAVGHRAALRPTVTSCYFRNSGRAGIEPWPRALRRGNQFICRVHLGGVRAARHSFS